MLEILHDLFSYTFIVRALIVGTLVSLCAALLGVSLVLKRYSMIGDGLSHVGFGSIGCCNGVSLGTPSCCNSGCCGLQLFYCFD